MFKVLKISGATLVLGVAFIAQGAGPSQSPADPSRVSLASPAPNAGAGLHRSTYTPVGPSSEPFIYTPALASATSDSSIDVSERFRRVEYDIANLLSKMDTQNEYLIRELNEVNRRLERLSARKSTPEYSDPATIAPGSSRSGGSKPPVSDSSESEFKGGESNKVRGIFSGSGLKGTLCLTAITAAGIMLIRNKGSLSIPTLSSGKR